MPKRPAIEGVEFSDDQPVVETVAESTDFRSMAANEAFMNELVTILIHSSTDENQPPQVLVNVNGTNQPIIRGYPTKIKRKYVEVLARMKETRYNQVTRNPSAPDQVDMVARHGLVYPFDLVEDPNPKGRGWLNNVLAEAA
jgi:hypothetical protein